VILEGIRIHPPPGGLLLRLTPPEGDTINGISIPGGVEIGVNTWGMMRDEDVIGPDPEMFRPEQRLEIEEAKYAEMARVVDLTFGGGRFKCLVWGWPLWT
jgi:cytochrome P450